MALKDDVLALAKLKRTRNNLGLIQEMLAELREHADNAEGGLSALQSAREALEELQDVLDADDNPFMSWSAEVRKATGDFLAGLPEETESVDDMITRAESYAEEYKECLEDKDYSADDREEVWGNLLNALEDIAGAMT